MTERYYTEFAAAFVRGRLPDAGAASTEELLRRGAAAGLRLHKFKRSAALPRVRHVLGVLRGVAPADLLDVGSGRGVFLWPLLDALPHLSVTAIDRRPDRVADLDAVRRGGVARLRPALMDVTQLAFAGDNFDVVTFLEVLEHLTQPAQALAEAVRVARRFVIVSVPSKPDDNPEHIHLFDRQTLEAMLLAAGARRVTVEFVRNHIVATARV
jgi:2-polyprenyl-3-methyl-5-hydroxy-6-metoxy-1,4-benzoquinol methylase